MYERKRGELFILEKRGLKGDRINLQAMRWNFGECQLAFSPSLDRGEESEFHRTTSEESAFRHRKTL